MTENLLTLYYIRKPHYNSKFHVMSIMTNAIRPPAVQPAARSNRQSNQRPTARGNCPDRPCSRHAAFWIRAVRAVFSLASPVRRRLSGAKTYSYYYLNCQQRWHGVSSRRHSFPSTISAPSPLSSTEYAENAPRCAPSFSGCSWDPAGCCTPDSSCAMWPPVVIIGTHVLAGSGRWRCRVVSSFVGRRTRNVTADRKEWNDGKCIRVQTIKYEPVLNVDVQLHLEAASNARPHIGQACSVSVEFGCCSCWCWLDAADAVCHR